MENMTKLEYFAAKAMQGLLSNDEHIKDESSYPEITADIAVEYATALMSALENISKDESNCNKPAVMVELTCPRCGSTNTAPSDKENDAGCYDCGFVWQERKK